MPYPEPPRRRRWFVGVAVALLVVAGVAAAIVYGLRSAPKPASGAFSDATATSAIQGYLDALEQRDTEAIARNSLCGIYDAIRDRRSDQALAKLSSDAFRKQFSAAQVQGIAQLLSQHNQILVCSYVMRTSGEY
jgi:hypothetical protein